MPGSFHAPGPALKLHRKRVDLESGALVPAVLHPADQGGTGTLAATLEDAQAKFCAVRDEQGGVSSIDEPFDLMAEKAITAGKP